VMEGLGGLLAACGVSHTKHVPVSRAVPGAGRIRAPTRGGGGASRSAMRPGREGCRMLARPEPAGARVRGSTWGMEEDFSDALFCAQQQLFTRRDRAGWEPHWQWAILTGELVCPGR
jgi:hypothetical protein